MKNNIILLINTWVTHNWNFQALGKMGRSAWYTLFMHSPYLLERFCYLHTILMHLTCWKATLQGYKSQSEGFKVRIVISSAGTYTACVISLKVISTIQIVLFHIPRYLSKMVKWADNLGKWRAECFHCFFPIAGKIEWQPELNVME